jgi:hypothetical protein
VATVPKSIDNDILLIDKCFGFDTAVAEAHRALLAAKVGCAAICPALGALRLPAPASSRRQTVKRTHGRRSWLGAANSCSPQHAPFCSFLQSQACSTERALLTKQIHIVRAQVEAMSGRRGIGLVKLMGRNCGFIAMQASLASGIVDICLIPEVCLSTHDACMHACVRVCVSHGCMVKHGFSKCVRVRSCGCGGEVGVTGWGDSITMSNGQPLDSADSAACYCSQARRLAAALLRKRSPHSPHLLSHSQPSPIHTVSASLHSPSHNIDGACPLAQASCPHQGHPGQEGPLRGLRC